MRYILRVLILVAAPIAALLAFPTLMKAQQSPLIQPFPPPATPPATIKAISFLPASNNNITTDLGNGLTLFIACHDGGQPNSNTTVYFHNNGAEWATVNVLYSNGTTVTANGIFQPPFNPTSYTPSDYPASFLHARIEGQFIYANPTGNTTVNLHAYDGGSFCEIRGTAVFAPNPPGPPAPPVNK
jgi:hypothetical protein